MSYSAEQQAQRDEVDANFEVFRQEEPQLIYGDLGRFAIYRHQQRVAIKESFREAIQYAQVEWPDGRWSIQEIGAKPEYFCRLM
jgi:hypothetical protein